VANQVVDKGFRVCGESGDEGSEQSRRRRERGRGEEDKGPTAIQKVFELADAEFAHVVDGYIVSEEGEDVVGEDGRVGVAAVGEGGE
jgi:hypothetical protein